MNTNLITLTYHVEMTQDVGTFLGVGCFLLFSLGVAVWIGRTFFVSDPE